MKLLMPFVAFCFLSTSSWAAPLWKVSKGDSYLYIGGVFDGLINEDVQALYETFRAHFKYADIIAFETNPELTESETKAFREAAHKILRPSNHPPLSTTLTAENLKALYEAGEELGIDQSTLDNGTSAVNILMLWEAKFWQKKLQQSNFAYLGFHDWAESDGKKITYLRPVENILHSLKLAMGIDPNHLIETNLPNLANFDELAREGKKLWLAGDTDGYFELMAGNIKKYENIFDLYVHQRNNYWLRKLTELIETKETEFVLLNINTLGGPEGVLSKLRATGANVEQIERGPLNIFQTPK